MPLYPWLTLLIEKLVSASTNVGLRLRLIRLHIAKEAKHRASRGKTNKQLGLMDPLQEAEWRCCGGGKQPGRLRKAESGHGGPVSAGPRSGTGAREV